MTKDRKEKAEVIKVSFDAYFRMLMNKNSSVRPHHKAPMKNWATKKGFKEASVEEFDKLLKGY